MIVRYNSGNPVNGFQSKATICHVETNLKAIYITKHVNNSNTTYALVIDAYGPTIQAADKVLARTSNNASVQERDELIRKLNYFLKCLEKDYKGPTFAEVICDLTVAAPTEV